MYWYLIGGENMAIEYATNQDLPADSVLLIEKVYPTESRICNALKNQYPVLVATTYII